MSENHPVEKLDKMQAEKELIRLNEILDRANSDYYSNDAPILSDAEYDTLKKEI
jgi:DNA ligase (NAD+)